MAQKKAVPTDDELSAMFAGIGDDDEPESTIASTSAATTQPSTSTKPTPTSSTDNEDDPLAELANLAVAPRAISRPSTPRVGSSAATSVGRRSGDVVHTPPSSESARSSLEKTRNSGEGARVAEQKAPRTPVASTSTTVQPSSPPSVEATTPKSTQATSTPVAAKSGGSWWGGLSAMASAAVKQAEAAVKEIQQNEEAQRWAEQVKGNVGALRGLGGQISSRALPAFTDILHTLAPPISQHERLQIHITHDLVGYPSLEPLVYGTFSRVMSQVEGGDLLVIQQGSESAHRRASEAAYSGSGGSGWNDGPWWREVDLHRSVGAVKGLPEGTKLVVVSARSYADEFYASRGGLDEATKLATENLSEGNPVRQSDIFIAIQAISYTATSDLFAADSATSSAKDTVVDESASSKPDDLVAFAVHLHDPVHSISFSALSQPIPQQWADWLDAVGNESGLPEEIVEIIESGGVDPREWVSEWMEETISLSIGVVAQRYVARRMGVGEGGIGRGKRREMIVESGGGEAARAI